MAVVYTWPVCHKADVARLRGARFSGHMAIDVDARVSLPGHEHDSTIVVKYSFPSGIQVIEVAVAVSNGVDAALCPHLLACVHACS